MHLIIKILIGFPLYFYSPVSLFAQTDSNFYEIQTHQIKISHYNDLISKTFIYPQLTHLEDKKTLFEINTFLFQQFVPPQEELWEDLTPEPLMEEELLLSTSHIDFNIKYKHTHYLSLEKTYSVEVVGVPHAQWGSDYYNFDLHNGTLLKTLDDLLIHKSDSILNQICTQHIPDFLEEELWLVIEKQEFYVFKNNDSNLWLGIYIAPYGEYQKSDGTIFNNGYVPDSFEIPLKKLKSILKPDFAFLLNEKD